MNIYSDSEINKVLYENIDAILVVSSKDDSYRALKISRIFSKFIAEEGSYKDLIEKLMFHMNDSNSKITEDYQIFLPKMGEFNGRNSRKLNVEIDGEKQVIQMLVYPIDKSEGDYVILLFELDKSELERDVVMEKKVKTIQETYLFSMYVDLNNDSVSSINVSEISNDDMHYTVKYSEWRMMIVNMIWPEDQELFLKKTDPSYLKDNLKPSKTFSFDCQMKNLEGNYIWVKLIFGRTDTTSDQDFRFVFMVQDIHDDSLKLFNELKKFETLASHDSLTGVFNHGRIETELSNAIEQININNRQVSLMMFDIDFFKKINDTYGHAVGDDILKEFVGTIKEKLAGHDIKIGRWGGEEFVCVCYDFGLNEIQKIAEEIRLYISNKVFEIIGSMTCSVGLATVGKNDSVKEAFIRLDEALYKAKASGRNCISFNQSKYFSKKA